LSVATGEGESGTVGAVERKRPVIGAGAAVSKFEAGHLVIQAQTDPARPSTDDEAWRIIFTRALIKALHDGIDRAKSGTTRPMKTILNP
jgi:hypothetical protein